MTRRIGDDETALGRGEKTIRHVDGDFLLALRLKSIDQQRQVETFALGAEFLRVGFERLQLIFEDQLGFVE